MVEFFPPVDTGLFQPDPWARKEARDRLGLTESDVLVGALANLTPQKGLEGFIEMARKVRSSGTRARFIIVGGTMETHGAYELMLRAAAARYGEDFGEPLKIVDPGSRPERWLNAFDIFVLSSEPRSEGVPTAILEAMATAMPVVATDVGAVSEVVANARTGYLVPPRDSDAMARAVAILAADAGLRRSFGTLARTIAINQFDVERCADTHVRAFEAAIRNEFAASAPGRIEGHGAMSVDLSRPSRRGYRSGRPFAVRAAWLIVEALVFLNPVVTNRALKTYLLRAFGAHVGKGLVIKPNVHIKYPWQLTIGDHVWLGERS